jgi:hypothetical protein
MMKATLDQAAVFPAGLPRKSRIVSHGERRIAEVYQEMCRKRAREKQLEAQEGALFLINVEKVKLTLITAAGSLAAAYLFMIRAKPLLMIV